MRALRDAARSLRAQTAVSLVAILSLALGIGANTAIFSILDGLLLRTLPVREPDWLVLLAEGLRIPEFLHQPGLGATSFAFRFIRRGTGLVNLAI